MQTTTSEAPVAVDTPEAAVESLPRVPSPLEMMLLQRRRNMYAELKEPQALEPGVPEAVRTARRHQEEMGSWSGLD